MDRNLPPPTPVAIAVLNNIPSVVDSVGGRISIEADAVLPCLRVAHVGDQAAISDWEAAPMFQVDVWAEDYVQAEQIAWDLRNVWPSATKQRYGDAVVHGRWVVQNPMSLPARINAEEADEETGFSRFLVTLAFLITGEPHE